MTVRLARKAGPDPECVIYVHDEPMSSLANFILENTGDILTEWQNFAATVPSAKGMDRAALRNDAAQMLATIAAPLPFTIWASPLILPN